MIEREQKTTWYIYRHRMINNVSAADGLPPVADEPDWGFKGDFQ